MNRVLSTIVCFDVFGASGRTLSISNSGEVYSFGRHPSGALGHEGENVIFPPKIIPSLKNIKSIACGEGHSICLDYNGDVFSFGENDFKQLGLQHDENGPFTVPIKIDIPPIKQISCGDLFTICLSMKGELYSFGSNTKGQLGLGTFEGCHPVTKIENLQDIDFVECGGNFAVCFSSTFGVYVWGDNEHGQLGTGNQNSPFNLPYHCENWPNDIVDIKCGQFHTLVLTSNGTIYSCGQNKFGQLARKTDEPHLERRGLAYSPSLKISVLSDIVRIECGFYHSMCIDEMNHLYIFGNNLCGQLGLGHKKDKKEPTIHPSLQNIVDISSKGDHTFVKTSNNEIYAFGDNNYSQLGINMEETDEVHQPVPIQVFEDNKDIWCNGNKPIFKSARSIL